MNEPIYKVGFWSGLIAFFSTVSFIIVQTLQLFGVLSYLFLIVINQFNQLIH